NTRRLDTPPGGTAKRMRRLSDYGVRLREKQKLRSFSISCDRSFAMCFPTL
ncbi:MAG: 30S ribosomal protein S4, partial [Proteobacteria bacterium]|nr:30S ribosomal protein S4 [Pseudomonadota bacterium]